MNKIQKGFTLIELMIVIAIIGILASIAIPSYQDYVGRSQVTEALTILSSYKIGLAELAQFDGDFSAVTDMADIGASQSGTYVSQVEHVTSGANTVVIRAQMKGGTDVNAQIRNLYVGFGSYNGGDTWICGKDGVLTAPVATATTVPDGMLPGTCR